MTRSKKPEPNRPNRRRVSKAAIAAKKFDE
jgi:hypothetical protein